MKTHRPFHRILLLMWTLFLSLLCFTSVQAEQITLTTQNSPPQSILFVGNSFSFYNNSVYTHLRGFLVAEDPSLRQKILLKSMTISGARLSDHRGGLTQMLNSRPWDLIVFQGQSREPVDKEMSTDFESTLHEFSVAARSKGAEPALFMTWAYADRPEMTAGLSAAYSRLGRKLNAVVVPVGLAFEQAALQIPTVTLHDKDRIHPSLEGTYLAAAVFYATLYGKSPKALDYTAGLDEPLARQLRQVAWQTSLNFHEKAK